MKYAIYTPGKARITRVVQCAEEAILDQIRPGEAYQPMGEGDDTTHYIEGATIAAMPPRPSKDHQFDYSSKAWFDPRTLADLQAAQWEAVKAARQRVLDGGFTWDGSTFDSDEPSRAFVMGAVLKAMVDPSHIEVWTLADDTRRPLSAADILAAATVMGVLVSGAMATGRELRDAIYAATTPAAVAAVAWP